MITDQGMIINDVKRFKVRVLCFAPAIFMEYEYHYRYVFSVASDKLYWSFLALIFSIDKPGNLQLRALSN